MAGGGRGQRTSSEIAAAYGDARHPPSPRLRRDRHVERRGDGGRSDRDRWPATVATASCESVAATSGSPIAPPSSIRAASAGPCSSAASSQIVAAGRPRTIDRPRRRKPTSPPTSPPAAEPAEQQRGIVETAVQDLAAKSQRETGPAGRRRPSEGDETSPSSISRQDLRLGARGSRLFLGLGPYQNSAMMRPDIQMPPAMMIGTARLAVRVASPQIVVRPSVKNQDRERHAQQAEQQRELQAAEKAREQRADPERRHGDADDERVVRERVLAAAQPADAEADPDHRRGHGEVLERRLEEPRDGGLPEPQRSRACRRRTMCPW